MAVKRGKRMCGCGTYKGEPGDKDATVLENVMNTMAAMWKKGRTNGVSLGPHIRASQVKKSDSEMGPIAVLA